MTEPPSGVPPTSTPPPWPSPAGTGDGSLGPDRLAALASWMVDQASAFTPDALDRSAIEAGYAIEDVVAARARADERIRAVDALQPIKSTAKRAVVVAYLAVWASFGVAYLLNDAGSLDVDFAIFAVLGVALGIAVAMSFSVIRATRPDASRPTRALILLLVFPVILLVGVAGLCLPTAVPT